MSRKAFVLLSGGIDSTTCLYLATANYDEVEAISIDYGQKHSKETEFARKSCELLGVKHSVLNVKGIMNGEGVMLTDTSVEIPSISYDEIEGVSPTYVPFRNGTLLSVITAMAQTWVMQQIEDDQQQSQGQEMSDQERLELYRDSVGIYFGAHAEDAHNWAYPDCTPEFIGSMANAIYTGTYYTVRLQTPLMTLSKQQVIELGESVGVPWENTWSCYAGGEVHCGTCPTCQSRIQAFENAGIDDPTQYAKTPLSQKL